MNAIAPELPGVKCQCMVCAADCICPPNELALRAWSSISNIVTGQSTAGRAMTPGEREWCFQEIDQVEGYCRANHANETDSQLARVVLNAWRDYARDKGMI